MDLWYQISSTQLPSKEDAVATRAAIEERLKVERGKEGGGPLSE